MAKVKLTKNELKSQRDALKRFQRYLPTLQLKKQQLQMEMRKLDQAIHEKQREHSFLEVVHRSSFFTCGHVTGGNPSKHPPDHVG